MKFENNWEHFAITGLIVLAHSFTNSKLKIHLKSETLNIYKGLQQMYGNFIWKECYWNRVVTRMSCDNH